MGWKSYIISFILSVSCVMTALAEENKSTRPEPPNSAAMLVQKADIEALHNYEKKVDEIGKILNSNKRFTDARLRFYRRQLEAIYLNLEKRSDKYQQRIKSANKLVAEFTESKADTESNNQFKIKLDPYYVEKMQSFKQEIAFYKGRLLQIRLLEFKINAMFKNLTRLRVEVNKSGVWHQAAPFYDVKTWKQGWDLLVTYSSMLKEQYTSAVSAMSAQNQWTGFWFLIVLSLVILIVYFKWAIHCLVKLVRSENVVNDTMRRCTLWLLHVVCRGWLPGIFIVCVFKLIFDFYGLNTMPMLLNCLRALGNAIAFIFVGSAVVTASCQQFTYHGQSLYKLLSKPLLVFVYQFAILLFVNNVNIYNVDAKAYPFYPSETVDLITLLVSITIGLNLLLMAKRMSRLLRTGCHE